MRGLRVLHGGLDPHDDRDDGAADGGDHAEYDVFGDVLFGFELRSHGDPVDKKTRPHQSNCPHSTEIKRSSPDERLELAHLRPVDLALFVQTVDDFEHRAAVVVD